MGSGEFTHNGGASPGIVSSRPLHPTQTQGSIVSIAEEEWDWNPGFLRPPA